MKKQTKHILARKGIRDIPYAAYVGMVALMKLLRASWRVEIADSEDCLGRALHQPVIFACWHNRLLLTPTLVPRKLRHRTAGLASSSRDGEYAAQLMRAFGMPMVRGSTSRGGYRALIKMQRKLKENISVALTPDGPRGPLYQVQPGIVILAERTGCPVVPIAMNSTSRWELHGWDRTQIPKPFAKVSLVVGEPLTIQPRLTAEQRQNECERIRQALMAITLD